MALAALRLCYANYQWPSVPVFVIFIVLFVNRKFLFSEGSNFTISCGVKRVILRYCNRRQSRESGNSISSVKEFNDAD